MGREESCWARVTNEPLEKFILIEAQSSVREKALNLLTLVRDHQGPDDSKIEEKLTSVSADSTT